MTTEPASSPAAAHSAPSGTHGPLWTPVARGVARIARAQAEHPGSMHSFAAVLLQADVLLKLHAITAISVLGNFQSSAAARSGYDLSRTGGTGMWANSLRVSLERLRPFLGDVSDPDLSSWIHDFSGWLTTRRNRADQDELGALLVTLRAFRGSLAADAGPGPAVSLKGSPIDIMELLVEIRNKTTGHAAYGAEFYREHVGTIEEPVKWLTHNSPLWKAELALTIPTARGPVVRIFSGSEPSRSRSTAEDVVLHRAYAVLPGDNLQRLLPLISLDAGDNSTYLANGNWRDSDSTAEFLCHALEAATPESGKRRIPLANYAVRPAAPPPSETEGLGALRSDDGVVLNNLPAPASAYVARSETEERLRMILRDVERRHLVTVRGHGGIGKTSLILALCHEFAQEGDRCPYDAIVWMSARDIDLTLRGPRAVRRAAGSIKDVWRRFAELFEQEDVDELEHQQFFETTMRTDRILLVLDNFETFDDQKVAYEYFDHVSYPPSKTVITSRHDFQGDFTVPVPGMSYSEACNLLLNTARSVGAEPSMTEKTRVTIYERCRGHPYAMKLAAARLKSVRGVAAQLPQVLRDEELLEALFRSSIEDIAGDEDAMFVFLLVGQFDSGLAESALRVATDCVSIDLDAQAKVLSLRSLIDLRSNGHVIYDMPTMAREFARKFMAGHELNAEVQNWRDFLGRWTGLDRGQNADAAARMLRAVRDRTTPQDTDRTLSALRTLASFEPYLWVMLARAQQFARAAPDEWESSYKRAVEENEGRPDILWEWASVTPSTDRQIALRIQAVAVDPANVALASQVAHFLNSLYAKRRSRYTLLRWAALMSPVIEALEDHFEQLDAEALSRLAWLYIHSRQSPRAKRVVLRGLDVEPHNVDIRKLATRQGLLDRHPSSSR